MENEDIEEKEEAEGTTSSASSGNDAFKGVVITEMTRIIKAYRDKMYASDDKKLIEAMNKKTDFEPVINHIMNNLTEKRIYGGADEITYEYIHEYYVDDFNKVEDRWSSYIRGGYAPVAATPGPKEQAKKEAESKVTDEMREKYYQEALDKAQREAQLKAEAKIRADEEKRKAKEKELAEKKKAEELAKKEAEAKRKAEEESNKPKQMSLFDL